MRKWRPTFKSIYVIPEVRGDIRSLEVILNRILPLRMFKNQEDVIVMLGDYINGDTNSDAVIDCIINIKEEYKDRAIILRGKHEELMLRSRQSDHDFNHWVDNGGSATIESYVNRSKLNVSPYAIKRNRIQDIIPAKHWDFLNGLDYSSTLDEYCFFNSGFNPNKPISENSNGNFVFDTSSSRYLKECLRVKKDPEFLDSCIYVGSNNYNDDKPFIHPKYFMLGGAAPGKLVVFELNSMSACAVSRGKSRIYKYDFSVHE